MKAVRFDEYGGVEVLKVVDVPDPSVHAGIVKRKDRDGVTRAYFNQWYTVAQGGQCAAPPKFPDDGSCMGNLQIVAPAALANYEAEVKKLGAGCSVSVTGEVKASPAKGQPTELHAQEIVVHGAEHAARRFGGARDGDGPRARPSGVANPHGHHPSRA